MTISKRLRYEILNRDGFACRYCGGKAPEAVLVVDHVTPKALGGSDAPSNLVAACRDCNTGKSSVSPDAKTVADVDHEALEWAHRVKSALAEMADERADSDARVNGFYRWWQDFGWPIGYADVYPDDFARPIEYADVMPGDWYESIERFLNEGLDLDMLKGLAEIAMLKRGVSRDGVWRYFCGVCWRHLEEAHERARDMQ